MGWYYMNSCVSTAQVWYNFDGICDILADSEKVLKDFIVRQIYKDKLKVDTRFSTVANSTCVCSAGDLAFMSPGFLSIGLHKLGLIRTILGYKVNLVVSDVDTGKAQDQTAATVMNKASSQQLLNVRDVPVFCLNDKSARAHVQSVDSYHAECCQHLNGNVLHAHKACAQSLHASQWQLQTATLVMYGQYH